MRSFFGRTPCPCRSRARTHDRQRHPRVNARPPAPPTRQRTSKTTSTLERTSSPHVTWANVEAHVRKSVRVAGVVRKSVLGTGGRVQERARRRWPYPVACIRACRERGAGARAWKPHARDDMHLSSRAIARPSRCDDTRLSRAPLARATALQVLQRDHVQRAATSRPHRRQRLHQRDRRGHRRHAADAMVHRRRTQPRPVAA